MHILRPFCGIFTATLTLPTFTFATAVDQTGTFQPAASNAIQAVTQCRTIESDAARLACFDAAAATLAAAGEVAIVSRQEIQQNQRRLFGFDVSIVNPFDRDGRTEELQSITATLTSARNLGRGEWIITLDDGSIWRKIDSGDLSLSTRRRYSVTVRRAAMGSYMMKVGDAPPFRVRRQ
ncbi:hypothetical protein [Brevundimonas sp. SORGH_AS_0993]|uniref:hypothetical protein n=1 Tax=Brevundimonas sp. SORGH_AS_0993 TaxID=3041794 RepID=UPI00277F3CE0|nr:hypothetical protein [Brevundimonas sp. SORGH_AS_0993]MDQ1153961.1 hypothetical protein [Brevundimonas sp. SORGH_AS_0993]